MTANVTHGADPEQLDRVAEALHGLGGRAIGVATQGSGLLGVLHGCWSGPDMDGFVRGWDAAQRRTQSAADHLTRFAAALHEQAEQQRGASEGGGAGAGAAGGGAPVEPGPAPSPTSPPVEPPSGEPRTEPTATPGPPPVAPSEDTIDRVEDPGDKTEVPKGVSKDDPWVQEMMKTPEGRKTLQWLHDHGYEIDTSGKEGDKYYHSGKRIYLGPSWQNGGALIHEANHAEAKVTGTTTTFGDSRDDYVDGKIDEEVESNSRQLEYGRKHGPDQPFQRVYDASYEGAYDDAISQGKSPAEAEQAGLEAGREEIRALLENGELSPTGFDGNYRQYYGDQWDAENDKPWYWPF